MFLKYYIFQPSGCPGYREEHCGKVTKEHTASRCPLSRVELRWTQARPLLREETTRYSLTP